MTSPAMTEKELLDICKSVLALKGDDARAYGNIDEIFSKARKLARALKDRLTAVPAAEVAKIQARHDYEDSHPAVILWTNRGREAHEDRATLLRLIRQSSSTADGRGVGWQGIESAPKDGTYIDIQTSSGFRRCGCVWHRRYELWGNAEGYSTHCTVVAWMLSPKPFVPSTQGKE